MTPPPVGSAPPVAARPGPPLPPAAPPFPPRAAAPPPLEAPGAAAGRAPPLARAGWIGLLAFASGAPNGIATQAVPTLYAASGVDLAAIGLLAFVEVPYLAKALWAPAVDRWGDRRTWAALSLAAIATLVAALALLPADSVPVSAWLVLYGIVIASATLDLASDAWAVEAVPAEAAGPAAAVRVTAYRAALVVAGGFLVARAATLGRGPTFGLAAVVLAALAVAAKRAPATPRRPRAAAPVRAPLLDLARRPGFVAFAAFVVLFKAGDYLMGRMTKPCLLARGFSAQEIGDLVTPLEIGATVLGAWVGAGFTRRWGIFRALWVLGLLQAVSNLGYAAAADAGKPALWAAATLEPFCSGLGTAPFLALLLVSCRKEHAAVQFALLTALMAFGRILAGSVSGVLATSLGFSAFFALTFLAALPAFLLLRRAVPALR